MDYSLPGSAIHGILLARLLEWVAVAFSECLGYSASKEHYLFTNCKYILEAKQYGNSKSIKMKFSSIQFSSVQFSRSAVSDSLRPHESQQPGLPVHRYLPEFTQTHIHRVSDAIQPSHPLSSPSPPAPNPSQHQGIFQSVSSSHEVAKVMEFQLQHHSFQRNPRADLL